MNHDSEINLYH